jgi:hypothetical protein
LANYNVLKSFIFFGFVGFVFVIFLGAIFIITNKEKIIISESPNSQKNSGLANDVEIENLKSKVVFLEKEKDELIAKQRELEQENKSCSAEYSDLFADINVTIYELNRREQLIRSSLNWFKENSDLKNIVDDSYRTILNRYCFKISDSDCKLHLGCLYLINEKEFRLYYRNDKNSDNNGDQLFNLKEFLSRKGGDCEDFSLFFKAEVNEFLRGCGDVENKKVKMLTYADWKKGFGEYETQFFLDFLERNWYIPQVNRIWLDDYKYPVVVCGNMYDLQSKKVNGHCIIALLKNKPIDKNSLFTELNNSPLIEPQSGEFVGYLNSASSNILLKDEYVGDENSSITSIITDEDYFLYDNFTSPHWINYSFYLERIIKSKSELEEFLSE